MQNMGLLMEYEDILLKKRKDFSATYIGQNASQKDIKELFQYVFENLLEWTPEMARDYLTMDTIQKLHLMRPLRKLEYPPEINIDQDLFSVAWMVYPEQIHISRHELVLNVYQKVLSDKLIKYPKKFFLVKPYRNIWKPVKKREKKACRINSDRFSSYMMYGEATTVFPSSAL